MSGAGATRWLAVALALSYVACSAHAGVSKPEPIVAKEFSFSDELNDAFVVALGSNVAAVPLSAGEHAALAGDDPSAVMMTAHDGQRYFCALPRQSRDADGGSREWWRGRWDRRSQRIRDRTRSPHRRRRAQTTDEPVLLQDRGMVDVRAVSHEEDPAVPPGGQEGDERVQPRGVPRGRDGIDCGIETEDESATPPGGAPPYHAHVFTEGTPCDLTDLKRQTEVRLTCAPNGVNVIVGIEEPSTCRYVFTFQTPELCKRSEFRAPTKETSHIRCKAVADGVDAGGDTPGTVRGKSFSVPLKKTEL